MADVLADQAQSIEASIAAVGQPVTIARRQYSALIPNAISTAVGSQAEITIIAPADVKWTRGKSKAIVCGLEFTLVDWDEEGLTALTLFLERII